MKTFLKKITIIITILIIMLSSCFDSNLVLEVQADTPTDAQVECGNILSAFCINFYNNYGQNTKYDETYLNGVGRDDAYKGNMYNGKWEMDCVGWVSFAYHQSLKIGGDSFTYFACPPGKPSNGEWQSGSVDNGVELVAGSFSGELSVTESDLNPGDILFVNPSNYAHVLIYVGEDEYGKGKVIHSFGGEPTLLYDNLSDFNYCAVARITPEVAESVITSGKATEIFNGQGGITSSDIKGGKGNFINMGTMDGEFSQITYNLEWILDSLSQILDWLIGIATYLIRMVFLGWAGLFEMIINGIMSAITDEDASLTIEKLVTNRVPILDANFFNFAKAGGEDIAADSVLYVIRENIAMWYYIIRNITIIGLLITLIYIGIRMAISTVAESKAKYKSMLINWVVSFIIVFFIHYIMIAIMQINEIFIDTIKSTMGAEESLYDTVRNQSYAIQASVGWPATIMYILLIYLLVRFLIVYIKRFLTIGILTFLAPIVAIGYAIDKIKDNKSQSLSNWLREYTINVIIQAVHCLLYYLFITLAFNVAGKSLRGILLALLLVNFVLKAEKIFKTIFGMKSKSGSLQDTVDSAIGILAAAKVGGKLIKTNAKAVGLVAKPITKPIRGFRNSVNNVKRQNKISDIKTALDDAKQAGSTSIFINGNEIEVGDLLEQAEMSGKDTLDVASDIQDELDDMKLEDREFAKSAIKGTLKDIAGTAGMIAAAPMMIVDEGVGSGLMMAAKGLKTGTIKGYKKQYIDENYNKNYKGLKGQARKLAKKQAKRGRRLARLDPGLLAAKQIGNVQNFNRTRRMSSAQYRMANRYLEEQIQNEYDKLQQDPNIDKKELENVLNNANTLIPEEIITDTVYRMSLNIDIDATVERYEQEVGKKLTDNTKTESINTVAIEGIKEISGKVTNFKDLDDEIDIYQLDHTREITIDKKIYVKNIKAEIKKDLENDKKIVRIDKKKVKEVEINGKKIAGKEVTEKDIKKAFEKMTPEERKKIMLRAATNSNGAVEGIDDSLLEQRSNMRLADINKVIDDINKQTNNSIDTKEFKNNFNNVIRGRISAINGQAEDSITISQIQSVVSQMSGEQIISALTEAGTKNNVVLDKKYNKKEYETILKLMEQKKYNDFVLSKIGYDQEEAALITKRIKQRKDSKKGAKKK